MRLTAFRYGTTEISERMAFQDGDENIKLPISLMFFLIECKGKKILVDVGCDTMPGFELCEFEEPVKLLESYGVKRTEITDIVITHAHHDHIDAIRHYMGAAVFIHENEKKAAEEYLHSHKVKYIFEDSKPLCDGAEFRRIGGHSPGSGIVLISEKDRTLVLCGDECYTRENLLLGKPTGCSCDVEKSTSFVKEYAKDCYIPVLFHDPLLVEGLGYKVLIDE